MPAHVPSLLARVKRRLYPDGRPSALARALNAVIARQHALGILTTSGSATLVVAGRRSGRPVALPLVIASVGGAQFVVSMLGEQAGWVRNVRAAGGRAVLLQDRRRVPVHLVEVPVEERAPVLRAYLPWPRGPARTSPSTGTLPWPSSPTWPPTTRCSRSAERTDRADPPFDGFTRRQDGDRLSA